MEETNKTLTVMDHARLHQMESLTQEQVLEQRTKRDKPGIITENNYMETSENWLFYHQVRSNRGRCFLVCKHWTAPRDLRQEKRWLVILGNGHCRLGERMCVEGHSIGELQHWPHSCRHTCPKFEKIPELRARNMTLLQRSYARMPPCKISRRLTCEKTHDECPLAGFVCKTKKHSTVENTQITKEKHK